MEGEEEEERREGEREEGREEKGGRKESRRREGERQGGRDISHTYMYIQSTIHTCLFSLIPKLCSSSTWPGNEVRFLVTNPPNPIQQCLEHTHNPALFPSSTPRSAVLIQHYYK